MAADALTSDLKSEEKMVDLLHEKPLVFPPRMIESVLNRRRPY